MGVGCDLTAASPLIATGLRIFREVLEHRRGQSAEKHSQDSDLLLHTDRIIPWRHDNSKHDVVRP